MKKIISLLLVSVMLIASLISLSSCGSDFKYYADTNIYTKTLSEKSDKIAELEGYDKSRTDNDLILFTKTDVDSGKTTGKVYNIKEGKVVFTGTDVQISLITTNEYVSCFTVTETSDKAITTTLYNVNGEKTHEYIANSSPNINSNYDLVSIDQCVYRVKADKIVLAKNFGDLASFDVSDISAATDDYYFIEVAGSSYQPTTVFIMNTSLETTGVYQTPGYSAGTVWGVIANGTIYVQNLEELDTDAEKYDYLYNSVKYNVHIDLVNPKNGKVKSGKFENIVLNFITSNLNGSFFSDEVKTAAVGTEVIDGKPDSSTNIYVVANNGKLTKLKDIVLGQGSFTVENNHMKVEDLSGRVFLYDLDGKYIGEITAATDSTSKYLITNRKVYNYSLEEVLDLEDRTVEEVFENNLIVSEGEKYYLFDGELKEITDYDSVSDEYYFTEKDEKYTMYNSEGKKLFENLDEIPSEIIYNHNKDAALAVIDGSYYSLK